MKFLKVLSLAALIIIGSGCQKQGSLVTVSLQPEPPATSSITSVTATSTIKKTSTPIVGSTATKPTSSPTQQAQIPNVFQLNVAFVQQAPFGKWDVVHEETCEEASMIMADKYFRQQPLTETIGEQEIQKIIAWENLHNYTVDLTAAETVKVLNDYYGLSARLSRDVTVDRIKYELFKGNIVIIPAAGRLLGNPNFKAPGPIYHMLLIKGYNDTEFITNDPGTRKGNSYKYSYERLLNAIHDWNPVLAKDGMTDGEMAQGEKVIIVVEGKL